MSIVGLKLTGILKGSASISFSDGERDSGLISQDLQGEGRTMRVRACKHACVQAWGGALGNCGSMKEME